MKHLLYKITDGLGWIFCEMYFRILNAFYLNSDPSKIMGWILTKMYSIGSWFYSLNDEIN
jgi:hypothetical protein